MDLLLQNLVSRCWGVTFLQDAFAYKLVIDIPGILLDMHAILVISIHFNDYSDIITLKVPSVPFFSPLFNIFIVFPSYSILVANGGITSMLTLQVGPTQMIGAPLKRIITLTGGTLYGAGQPRGLLVPIVVDPR